MSHARHRLFQQAYTAQQKLLQRSAQQGLAPTQPLCTLANKALSPKGSPSQRKGAFYENQAAQYLRQQGLSILARQLRYPYGEIDILAWSAPFLVVVEVRFRADQRYGGAGYSIGPEKKERLRRAGLHAYTSYQRRLGCPDLKLRFDVILCDQHQLQWLPNAIIYK